MTHSNIGWTSVKMYWLITKETRKMIKLQRTFMELEFTKSVREYIRGNMHMCTCVCVHVHTCVHMCMS